jgi:hypothetical protein
MCGTTLELLGSHCCSVSPLSVAPRVALGGWMWPGKRESPTRCSLLPLNAGTAEPFRVSPPEAVAYQLELFSDLHAGQIRASRQQLKTGRVGPPLSVSRRRPVVG